VNRKHISKPCPKLTDFQFGDFMNGAQSMIDTYIIGAQGDCLILRTAVFADPMRSEMVKAEWSRDAATTRVRWCWPRTLVVQDRAIPPGESSQSKMYTVLIPLTCSSRTTSPTIPIRWDT
jgi:hypothetical protein